MQFKKLTKEQMEYIIEKDGGWIVRNLLNYENSLVPKKYVKDYGFDCVKNRLERIIGFPVDVEKSMTGKDYIATVVHR